MEKDTVFSKLSEFGTYTVSNPSLLLIFEERRSWVIRQRKNRYYRKESIIAIATVKDSKVILTWLSYGGSYCNSQIFKVNSLSIRIFHNFSMSNVSADKCAFHVSLVSVI